MTAHKNTISLQFEPSTVDFRNRLPQTCDLSKVRFDVMTPAKSIPFISQIQVDVKKQVCGICTMRIIHDMKQPFHDTNEIFSKS